MKKTIKYTSALLGLVAITLILIGGGFGKTTALKISEDKALIFAHRGIAKYNAENSLKSFNKAIKLGFNAIETDVRSTKDGKLVLFHDENCNRLLGIDKNINDLEWNEIRDLFIFHNGNPTKDKVLIFDDLLSKINDSIVIYLDVKNLKKSISNGLLDIINKHNKKNRIVIANSNILQLSYLKYNNPEMIVALEGFNKGKEWIHHVIPKKFKPDYYSSYLSKVDENHLRFLRKNHLIEKKIVYGINSLNVSKSINNGLKNIIIDFDTATSNLKEIQSQSINF